MVAPDRPKDKTYNELVTVLKQHFEPKPLVIAERFHFHRRAQAVGESIAEYLAELRRLSTHCKFGAYLEEALRDRLVCGLRSEPIQRKLLTEADLTLARAQELSLGMEAADRNAKSLKAAEPTLNLVTTKSCYRCGKTSHDQKNCPHKDAECYHCRKRGHITAVCRSAKKSSSTQPRRQRSAGQRRGGKRQFETQKYVANDDEKTSDEEDTEYLPLHSVGGEGGATPPIKVPLIINDKVHCMELDTGTAITIMSQKKYEELFPESSLRNFDVLLKTYSGERLPVVGEMSAQVQHNQQACDLVLTVVAGNGPSLLGRDWLKHIQLNWREVHALSKHSEGSLEYLLDKYGDIFGNELGTIKYFCAELNVEPTANAKFLKARTVPYALRGPIEEELDRLEKEGIIEKITHSEWATPIVAVPKPDERVRLCGDFKVTVNQTLSVDKYPLPKVEDLLATLAGGKQFTKLDLSQAYLQLELHPQSLRYCTITTHRGLYQFKQLPFGIASAPAIFQKVMDTILQGLPGAICYIDDILVTGTTEAEHLSNLEKVIQKLQEYGVRMKKSKCFFLRDSVEYLGHKIAAEGIRATPAKIAAMSMPQCHKMYNN